MNSHKHVWKERKRLYPIGEEHICSRCFTRRVTLPLWGEGEDGGIHCQLLGHVYEYFERREGRKPYPKVSSSRLVMLPEWKDNPAARAYVNSFERR